MTESLRRVFGGNDACPSPSGCAAFFCPAEKHAIVWNTRSFQECFDLLYRHCQSFLPCINLPSVGRRHARLTCAYPLEHLVLEFDSPAHTIPCAVFFSLPDDVAMSQSRGIPGEIAAPLMKRASQYTVNCVEYTLIIASCTGSG